MKLASITLKNFRCYLVETTVPIGDLTTLIGRNDIGKSSILEALEIFFNNATVKIDNEDCSVSATDQTIEISCEFTDLPPQLVLDASAQTSLAAEYLLTATGTLLIKKCFKCTGSKPKEDIYVRAYHPSANEYHDLLELSNSALKQRLSKLKVPDSGVNLSVNTEIRRAIWSSCPDLQLNEVDIPVAKEDSKRVWDKLSEQLPLYAIFQSDRASKDSDSEVQDPMKLAIATALSESSIRSKLDEVVAAVRAKAEELAQRTHETLKKIDPALAAQLTPEFKAEPKWSGLFSLALNSDQGIPVNKRGSGVRRMILVSFFRAEAERRLAEGSTRSIIYAIEEPETSQHPHNQRILLESFVDLAAEDGCQVLLTTHSPGFATYLPVDCFRFLTNGISGQPHVEVPSEATWRAVVNTLGIVPDNRVRVLLCVEGPHDVSALKALSYPLHQIDQTIPDLSNDPRVAFVVLGGGALSHWVNENYLKGFQRPEVHIYDNDVAKYQASIDLVNLRGEGSWGVLTTKREMENYLHPDAIQEGLGITVTFGDTDDVPAIISAASPWNTSTAKRKLAQYAFPKMTAERIAEVDPHGEITGWFRRIAQLF